MSFVQSIRVKESTVFSRKYCTELTSLVSTILLFNSFMTSSHLLYLQSTLSVFEVEVWCYRGGNNIPQWILRQAGWYFPWMRRKVITDWSFFVLI